MSTVKSDISPSMQCYLAIRKMLSILRCVEAIVLFFFFAWFVLRLPVAVKASGNLFRQLRITLLCPGFMFVIGNAIVLTLIAKSTQFPGLNSFTNSSHGDEYLCREFLGYGENGVKAQIDEVEYEDKAVCSESASAATSAGAGAADEAARHKNYIRSQSELYLRGEKSPVLRRAVTDIKTVSRTNYPERVADAPCADPDVSNDDEFRCMIEAFIAKQQRFRREESLAFVYREKSKR